MDGRWTWLSLKELRTELCPRSSPVTDECFGVRVVTGLPAGALGRGQGWGVNSRCRRSRPQRGPRRLVRACCGVRRHGRAAGGVGALHSRAGLHTRGRQRSRNGARVDLGLHWGSALGLAIRQREDALRCVSWRLGIACWCQESCGCLS